jgi:AcrR family transcriptional regulator
MNVSPNKRLDRRVRKTKRILKDSLATLLLEKNLNNITVQELVNLADINRGTFYLHYRDIHDMLSQIEAEMLEELEEMTQRFPPSMTVSPNPFIKNMLQYIADNHTFCKMLLGPYGDMAFVEKLKNLVEERCLSSLMNSLPENYAKRYCYFASYTISGCVGLIQTWLNSGMEESPQEMSEVVEDMILNGIEFLHRDAQDSLEG